MKMTRKQARFFAAETLNACARSGYMLPVVWPMSAGKLADRIYDRPCDFANMIWAAANYMLQSRETVNFRRFDELFHLAADPKQVNLLVDLYGMPTISRSVLDNYDPVSKVWRIA